MEGEAHTFKVGGATLSIPQKADMRYLYIEITNRCNLHCEMCFKQYWEDREGDMEWELFLKILDDAEEFPDLEMIYLGGIGEPTVHPRFLDMVTEVKKRGFALGMSTNGFLLTKERIRRLVELETDLIYISLDTIPTQTTRLGHIMPSVAVDRIKLIQETKREMGKYFPHVGVEVVASKENYEHLPDIARFLGEVGIDSLLISNIVPIRREHSGTIVYDGSVDMDSVVKELQSIYGGFVLRLPEFKLRTERHCDFVENKTTVIRWDGEVSPCYRLLHTYPEVVFGREKKVLAHSFGNVKDKSLKDIWTSRDYGWFRFVVENALYPSCTDCPLNTSCSFVHDTEADCWGNTPSCADCLWARRIVLCPVPMKGIKGYW
ncbi:tungsten cofactor oxidoreductase radical SAM maturase [Thermococcus sp.]|uniref:tungsten cofactor oxidoreductase radical SAM maturase n=1 Tax=Thermococcus sp. TaxID=35749 RepID=UPI002617CE28|nr:tungsten cofactor oxidoreductase radical SAM maturase [Thermococcus sp.]